LFCLMGCSIVQVFLVLYLIKSKVPSNSSSTISKSLERLHFNITANNVLPKYARETVLYCFILFFKNLFVKD